jgi:hypothetical protein
LTSDFFMYFCRAEVVKRAPKLRACEYKRR